MNVTSVARLSARTCFATQRLDKTDIVTVRVVSKWLFCFEGRIGVLIRGWAAVTQFVTVSAFSNTQVGTLAVYRYVPGSLHPWCDSVFR